MSPDDIYSTRHNRQVSGDTETFNAATVGAIKQFVIELPDSRGEWAGRQEPCSSINKQTGIAI